MWLCHNSAPDKGQPVNYVVKSMNETFRLELELFGILHKIIWSFWIIWKCQAHAPIACLSAYIQIFASLQEDLKLSVSFSEGPQHGETVSSDTLDIPYLPHTLILCLISWILRYRTGLFSQKTDREKRGEEEKVWRLSAPLLRHITASSDYTPIYLAALAPNTRHMLITPCSVSSALPGQGCQ